MKILYFLRDKGACSFYRAALPIKKMVELSNGEHSCMEFSPGDSLSKLADGIDRSDIILIPRLGEEVFIKSVEEVKKVSDKKIVIDHDDNIFKVSPFSPHYDCCGQEDVQVKMPDGSKIWMWKDGKNIDLKKNKKMLENTINAVKMADMVTVTQPLLEDVYRPIAKATACLPNCVDLNIWKPTKIVRNKDEIRMGWAGGHSHYEDWCLLTPFLSKVMKRYPNLKFVVSGSWFEGILKTIPNYMDRVEFMSWVDISAYPYRSILNDIDFFVIPLVDNEFNRCKSNIKWVEQSAIEVPSVTSYVTPYKEAYNGGNGIFVHNNDPDAWYEAVCYMIENPEERIKMGKEARKTVEENYDINKKAHLWADAYNELLKPQIIMNRG